MKLLTWVWGVLCDAWEAFAASFDSTGPPAVSESGETARLELAPGTYVEFDAELERLTLRVAELAAELEESREARARLHHCLNLANETSMRLFQEREDLRAQLVETRAVLAKLDSPYMEVGRG